MVIKTPKSKNVSRGTIKKKIIKGRPTSSKRAHGALKRATDKIDKLQSTAVDVLEAAMSATTLFAKINGRDTNGKCTYEYVEIVDHQTRTRAAAILLKKRIPDIQAITHSGDDSSPISLKITI